MKAVALQWCHGESQKTVIYIYINIMNSFIKHCSNTNKCAGKPSHPTWDLELPAMLMRASPGKHQASAAIFMLSFLLCMPL